MLPDRTLDLSHIVPYRAVYARLECVGICGAEHIESPKIFDKSIWYRYLAADGYPQVAGSNPAGRANIFKGL